MLPDVPTMIEQGMPVEIGAWFGFLAPAGTPPAAIAWLNREANKVMSPQDVKGRFINTGAAVPLGTPESFAKFMEAESEPLWRSDPPRRDQDGAVASWRFAEQRIDRAASAVVRESGDSLRRSPSKCVCARAQHGCPPPRRTIRRGRSACWCRRRPAASATSCRASSAQKLAETGTTLVVENRTGGAASSRPRRSPRRRPTAICC